MPVAPGDAGRGTDAAADHTLLANVPAVLRERKQWLLWRFETYEGDKKPRKVPYWVSGRKRRGDQGGNDDRRELATFDVAMTHLARGGYSGLGFAFLPGDGLVGIDIDGALDADTGEWTQRCLNIIQACASYTELSPSGRGVHIICTGATETFKDNSVGVEVFCGRQFFTVTGRVWEGAPLDVAPLADATLARLKATVKGGKAKAPRPPAAPAGPADDLQQRLESALQALGADMPHDDWVHVGMGLKAALGDAGFRLWDYWSSKGAKYPGTDVLAKKWASFDGTGLTEATVFKMALQAGWKPPRKPRPVQPAEARSTPSTGSRGGGGKGRSGGGGGDGPADDGEKRERPAWMRRLKHERNGLGDCRENVFIILTEHDELKGLVGWDEFAHRVMKLRTPPWDSPPGEWTPQDDYSLGLWLMERLGLTIRSEATLVAGVGMAAWAKRFHPVLAYLNGLPAWDGIERLPYWLSECLGAEDSTYTRLVGTWFLMGMVQRALRPGCQMDYMIVLEGLQGRRKSTALATLLPNRDWFADTPMRLGDKESMLSLAGKWLVEMGELASLSRAETEEIKQYLSSRVDRVREPFARRYVDRPRSSVFGGTTNQGEYFKDPTGARRFWPVHCHGVPERDGGVDLDKLAEWRDHLFAEAMARLASDDPEVARYYPTRAESEAYLQPEQEQREISDPWFERLATWLDSTNKYGDSMYEVRELDSFTAHELLTRCIGVPMDRIDGARQMSTRIGIAMHKLGWAKVRDPAPPRLWRYWRPGSKRAGDRVAATAGGPADGGDA